MTHTLFFRLLSHEEKGAVLAEAVAAVREGKAVPGIVHSVDPTSFRQIPGAPFAYWVSERVRRLFTELPPFESDGRAVRVGLQTSDDFRFVRTWWEVPPQKILTGTPATTPEEYRRMTFEGKRWAPFAKGGAYSPYYADLHLVVNWERDGEEMKAWAGSVYASNSHWSRNLRSVDVYFRPGLTWSLRTQQGFNMRACPHGAVFANKGPVAFANADDLQSLLALTNSIAFRGLVALQMTFGSYEVGVVQRSRVPKAYRDSNENLAPLAAACVEAKQALGRPDETSHIFTAPALIGGSGSTLEERVASCLAQVAQGQQQLAENQAQIDGIVLRMYDIDAEDRRAIEESLRVDRVREANETENAETDEDDEDEQGDDEGDAQRFGRDVISYAYGCAVGRWDVRLATGQRVVPRMPGPFNSLPVCSPGMLTGSDGLPLGEAPPGYPLRIDPDGT